MATICRKGHVSSNVLNTLSGATTRWTIESAAPPLCSFETRRRASSCTALSNRSSRSAVATYIVWILRTQLNWWLSDLPMNWPRISLKLYSLSNHKAVIVLPKFFPKCRHDYESSYPWLYGTTWSPAHWHASYPPSVFFSEGPLAQDDSLNFVRVVLDSALPIPTLKSRELIF